MKNLDSKANQGFSDIGVKNGQNARLRDADGEKMTDISNEAELDAEATETSEMSADSESELHTAPEEGEDLDAEFEELIRTKYKSAYSKRTEAIVRRRLRSVRNKTDGGTAEAQGETPTENAQNAADSVSVTEKSAQTERKKLQIMQNQNRPSENGIGTSVGMYARADVSKLTGKDIRDILDRAGRGERIRFR